MILTVWCEKFFSKNAIVMIEKLAEKQDVKGKITQ
jgi:hypothetical protein